MFPERIILGLGTGEAMNEIPLGYKWPPFKERAERLEEAIRLIRLLWSEEFTDFKGRYYQLRKANLYTKPKNPIPLYVAANGPTVARIAGRYADGFITPVADLNYAKSVLFPALYEGAKDNGRDASRIETVVELSTCYDQNHERGLEYARKIGAAATPLFFKLSLHDPRDIEEFGKLISDEVLTKKFLVSSEPEPFINAIEKALESGFTQAYFSGMTADEPGFLEMLEKHVIPYLKSTYADRLKAAGSNSLL
jgi:coenzyme F420-dependent glucose-6-phosphate dehydrogenase